MEYLHTQFYLPLWGWIPGLEFKFLSEWEAFLWGNGFFSHPMCPWSLFSVQLFKLTTDSCSLGFLCHHLCHDPLSVLTAAPWVSVNFKDIFDLPSCDYVVTLTHIAWVKVPVLSKVMGSETGYWGQSMSHCRPNLDIAPLFYAACMLHVLL